MFVNRIIRGVTVPCVAMYIVAILLIVSYGHILRKTGRRDILEKTYINHPILQNIDGWSVTHLIFFGILGAMYPGHHLQFFLIGAGWEMVETFLGQNKIMVGDKRLQLVGEQDETGVSTGNDDAYWYGKSSDIIVDNLGYAIGSAVAEKYWPNTCAGR